MELQDLHRELQALDTTKLNKLKECVQQSKHIILLGNGGSNAISCHIAEDYTKMLKKQAICFGDSARMSCYANDYGWDQAFVKFVEHLAEPDTLVILLSSSGNSLNIVNVAEYCKHRHRLIIFSGFDSDNLLRSYRNFAELEFWVDSRDYGIVECMHEIILHSII